MFDLLLPEQQFRAILAALNRIENTLSAIGRTLNIDTSAIKTLIAMEKQEMNELQKLLAGMQGVEPLLASAKAYEDANAAADAAKDAHAAELQKQIDALTANQNDPALISALQAELVKLQAAAAAVAGPAPAAAPADPAPAAAAPADASAPAAAQG